MYHSSLTSSRCISQVALIVFRMIFFLYIKSYALLDSTFQRSVHIVTIVHSLDRKPCTSEHNFLYKAGGFKDGNQRPVTETPALFHIRNLLLFTRTEICESVSFLLCSHPSRFPESSTLTLQKQTISRLFNNRQIVEGPLIAKRQLQRTYNSVSYQSRGARTSTVCYLARQKVMTQEN